MGASVTARGKIEQLTNAWYGYTVCMAGVTFLYRLFNGQFGLFSTMGQAASLGFSLFVVFLLGRSLLNRSSLTRVFLLVIAGMSMIADAFLLAKCGRSLLHSFSLTMLAGGLLVVSSISMNLRSLRVLLDRSVRAYIQN